MIHKLTELDRDCVLPKKQWCECIGNCSHEEHTKGYNEACSDHQNLGIEIDVEELAKVLNDRYGGTHLGWPYSFCLQEARAIFQSPSILKLVKVKE